MEYKGTRGSETGEKPTWDWVNVEGLLRTYEAGRRTITWNLKPDIVLTNPNKMDSNPITKLHIDTERSLQYSHQLGWNWHKSWNLPNISVGIEVRDELNSQIILCPKNLYAQIFAVKQSNENTRSDKLVLIDVGIRGESKIEMIEGQIYFSGLKFSSTTYNNEGMRFKLIIVLFIEEDENKRKILTSVVSQPIFVDSRRSARDYQEKKYSFFIEPFGLSTIEKDFIKRENKSKNDAEVGINNDPDGLYNYLTAPNIRHKVKHPVFLAIKFNKCVFIYINQKDFPSTMEVYLHNTQLHEIIEKVQGYLLKEDQSNRDPNEEKVVVELEQKSVIIAVQDPIDSLKKKKVMESLEALENSSVGVVFHKVGLPTCFVNILDRGDLKQGYRQAYPKLIDMCKNYQLPSQEESEKGASSDEYNEGRKKVKAEAELVKTRRQTIAKNNGVGSYSSLPSVQQMSRNSERGEGDDYDDESKRKNNQYKNVSPHSMGFRQIDGVDSSRVKQEEKVQTINSQDQKALMDAFSAGMYPLNNLMSMNPSLLAQYAMNMGINPNFSDTMSCMQVPINNNGQIDNTDQINGYQGRNTARLPPMPQQMDYSSLQQAMMAGNRTNMPLQSQSAENNSCSSKILQEWIEMTKKNNKALETFLMDQSQALKPANGVTKVGEGAIASEKQPKGNEHVEEKKETTHVQQVLSNIQLHFELIKEIENQNRLLYQTGNVDNSMNMRVNQPMMPNMMQMMPQMDTRNFMYGGMNMPNLGLNSFVPKQTPLNNNNMGFMPMMTDPMQYSLQQQMMGFDGMNMTPVQMAQMMNMSYGQGMMENNAYPQQGLQFQPSMPQFYQGFDPSSHLGIMGQTSTGMPGVQQSHLPIFTPTTIKKQEMGFKPHNSLPGNEM